MMGPLVLSSALAVLLHLSTAYSAISPPGSGLPLTSLRLWANQYPDAVCVGQITLAETYIGQDKNVQMQYASCPDLGTVKSRVIDVRQTVPDVCGTPCTRTLTCTAMGLTPTYRWHKLLYSLRWWTRPERLPHHCRRPAIRQPEYR